MTDYKELGDILGQIHMGVTIADKNGIFVYAGKSYLDFTGIEQGWLEGRSAFDEAVLERFSPCVTAMVYEKREKITTVQRMRSGVELFVTGIPVFDADGELEMIICHSSWEITSYDDLYGTYAKTITADNTSSKYEGIKKVTLHSSQDQMICASSKTEAVKRLLNIFASAARPAYVYGPDGCGKHFMAVHAYSGSGGLYEYNCKFSDETEMHRSLFDENEKIRNGCRVLILRAVECMSRSLQRSLVRCAFSGEVTVIGISVYPLDELKKTGRIIDELYNYFKPYTAEVAPLSERREDLKAYIDYYLNLYNHMYSRNISLSSRAKNILLCCEWKENINEVRAFMERLVLTAESERIDVYNLPAEITPDAAENYTYDSTLKDMMELYEKDIITSIYDKYHTSVALAQRLGISQATAVRKIHKYIGGAE